MKTYKPALVLFIISVVAGSILGAVYVATEEPIKETARQIQQEAMKEVLPIADEFNDVTEQFELTGSVYAVFEGSSSNGTEGYIIGVVPKGYAGDIKTFVSFNNEGVIQNIKVLEMYETPGLGALAYEEWFTSQYQNKTAPLEVVKRPAEADNEISAITASTITSNGVTSGVNEASEFFMNVVKGGN